MKLYLAGPMSGYPDHNFPAFNAEAARLRALGYEVVNPAELNLDVDHSQAQAVVWRACMRKDIHKLIECDGIAMMEGWQFSRGASLEYQIAAGLELRLFLCKDLK